MKIVSLFFFLFSITSTLVAQEYGRASYYADSFQGLKTANGELYDKNKMTSSHNTLPFGTMVRVTRLDNKKTVVVRINDRGPFIKGRIIELSRKAAEQLDLISAGEAQVKIDVVGEGTPVAVTNKTVRPKGGNASPSATNTIPTARTTSTTKRPDVYNDSSVPRKVTEKTIPSALPTEKMTKKSVEEEKPVIADAEYVRGKYNKYGLYKIQLLRPQKTGYGVQVASYTNYDNVMKQIADLQAKWFDDIFVNIEPGENKETSYKVFVGQFDTQAAAETYRKNLQRKHSIKGFVVNISDM